MEIHLNDNAEENDALYLESRIGFQDLESFVCQDADDMNLLMNILRNEKGWKRTNVVQSLPMSRPPTWKERPNEGDLGFRCTVFDLFSAPQDIKNFLCSRKGIHKVPIFRSEHPDQERFPIRLIGTSCVTTKRSTYSNNFSTKYTPLTNQAQFLGQMDDNGDRELHTTLQAHLPNKINKL